MSLCASPSSSPVSILNSHLGDLRAACLRFLRYNSALARVDVDELVSEM